jgi:endoglucanase
MPRLESSRLWTSGAQTARCHASALALLLGTSCAPAARTEPASPDSAPGAASSVAASSAAASSVAGSPAAGASAPAESGLALDAREILTRRGLDVLVFSNSYDGNFSDAKIAGIELIHHGVRTATNGDVRLSPTPEQWDPVATLKSRQVHPESGRIEVRLAYTSPAFEYSVVAEPRDGGVALSVVLDQPLPRELEGKAGFNLEFLPSAYFGKTYALDAATGTLPLYPTGPTGRGVDGKPVRLPLAEGQQLVLAAEDAERRVSIDGQGARLSLYDGRNQAQNGWYVVRSPIPAGARGKVLEWVVRASVVPGWSRRAVIAHSQLGYHPEREKVALVETDPNAGPPGTARLLRVGLDGAVAEVLAAEPEPRGRYLRYDYYAFDFTGVREPGLYLLEAAGVRTRPFRIAADVLGSAWHPTLDVFFPVQMDHVLVNEAYRVWHGASHLDDARQAPINHEHFDLYAQGPATDSRFKPGQHIPGLNIGGWFDAGDFDLRTQTHYATVLSLVHAWEAFAPRRDETLVDQQRRRVELHVPDGVPDILQQIEHGSLMLVAQHRVFGHAIPGIVEPDLGQYTHLGDAVTKTDGKVDPAGAAGAAGDDRWAFTTATTALNYGSAAALAAASRALRGYRSALADECLAAARRAWDMEKARQPNLFRFGNTTGGDPASEELRAAVELLATTREPRYAQAIEALWPTIDARFEWHAGDAIRALPLMGPEYASRLRQRATRFRDERASQPLDNPFGVPITRGGWAGNGAVVGFATRAYYLHLAFPDLFSSREVLLGLEYLHGRHPGSDISFVSGVGAESKAVAYGANRADFSFIAGGVVPGALILKPDFPENKEDWPFLWGENEYVIALGAGYMFLAQGAHALLTGAPAPAIAPAPASAPAAAPAPATQARP